jgi:hypothetical protein
MKGDSIAPNYTVGSVAMLDSFDYYDEQHQHVKFSSDKSFTPNFGF